MVRKKNLLKDENGVPIKYEEDDLLTSAELAQAMRSSRWTIRKWVHAGYEFEFGSKTTARHCREWLRKNKE